MEKIFPGSVLLPIPNRIKDVRQWIEAVDPGLLILSNGNDWGTAPYRDALETSLVDFAAKKSIPTLFVCRGLQVLSALQGNRLEADIAKVTNENHVAAMHDVKISGGFFRKLAGGDVVTVNSYHNQGVLVSELRGESGLMPFAWTDGGILEGCVHVRHPFLALQWHPERGGGNTELDLRLITLLVEEGAFWNNE
ncbi:MAG: gamma-glutamyl-gamma-aminobutyrate hydrolase family protein [Alphaproteobacteria bacterium]|nr:gamma-glutamyl-gamma-aminobutyrate hydrolase family protein [Alphaproteobacteria bacterium]